METILEAIANYGVGIVCVGYLIYFQNTTMKEMVSAIKGVEQRLARIEGEIITKEENNDD